MNNFNQHELAIALAHYTTPSDPQYDPEFDAEIRRLRPDWFTPEAEEEARCLLQEAAQDN